MSTVKGVVPTIAHSSFGIPFALIPLRIFCRNRNVMGTLVNHRLTTAVATVVVTLIVSLNVFLLYQTFFA
jgi:manganese transport protein